ncbi:glycogen debranching N-terminal domain-containing protein [Streptomyces hygroscopicus]|uniref:glycogen debranching N-terminal domain-containing protein n=1 Tax=Streptomyces hygroscopicus TaxID=1912 RepID=UPI003A0FCC29
MPRPHRPSTATPTDVPPPPYQACASREVHQPRSWARAGRRSHSAPGPAAGFRPAPSPVSPTLRTADLPPAPTSLIHAALPAAAISTQEGQLTGRGLEGFYRAGRRVLSRCQVRAAGREPHAVQAWMILAPGLPDRSRTEQLARLLGGPAMDPGWGLRGLGANEAVYTRSDAVGEPSGSRRRPSPSRAWQPTARRRRQAGSTGRDAVGGGDLRIPAARDVRG